MLCLVSQSNDPYFNLATEEHFLKNTDEELFMLYVNKPSIISGKHQNILGEINLPWAIENNIVLARRLSGGGTVYHDNGNLNFSFIFNCPNLENISYRRFAVPIIQVIKYLGVESEFSGRNDLVIQNRKISGVAMHIYKKRVLYHGTLLYHSDLKNLSAALNNHPERYIDKSIKSIPSGVINISDFLNPHLTMTEFIQKVFAETRKHLDHTVIYALKKSDIDEIEKLSHEKYSTWKWIFGYSPSYILQNEIELGGQSVKFQLNIEKGLITSYNLDEDKNPDKQVYTTFDSLLNVEHDYPTLLRLFSNYNLINLLSGLTVEKFCYEFF